MTRAAGHSGVTPGAVQAARELPPTAAKLLAAARRILVRKGYSALTMQAIEQEAGVNRALVHYYFGSKAGLLEAMVESLFEDPAFGYSDGVMSAPAGPARARALLEWLRRITADRHSGLLLYELLPHILRSPKLRGRTAELYAAYRAFDGECLVFDDAAAEQLREDLGALSVAIVEGLGVQAAVDPDGFAHDRAFALWQKVITHYLRDLTDEKEIMK